MIIFDFTNPSSIQSLCDSWSTINDGVMGGVSRSQFTQDAVGVAVFSGAVSLENSGGFASVRSAPSVCDLHAFTGLILRVRGDGKRYKINLKTEEGFDGIQYQAAFISPRDTFTEIAIPFTEFIPMFRGRQVPDALPLNTASILTFGFLISDKQEGPFRLEIAQISGISGLI